ncbi:MAG: glycoside hydrolase family 32 protein [Chloroflexota bacterium]|nr:glycoside hydrolase family 32 protein [Chloroflexota bacterium]
MDLSNRPRYHFLPLANWMNDPNGLIQWEGRTHLFYQHNPHGTASAQKHWGHAVSDDLAHWTHLPIALAPTPGGPDEDGCYTGCAVDDEGTPTLIYTGVHPQVQCIATSTDGLITWDKYEGNPVIASPPVGVKATGFRDPYVWKEDDGWYMIIGSGIEDVGGAALLYRAQDLRHWEYLHPLCVGEVEEDGEMWECPNFFSVDGGYVLLVSALPRGQVLYYTGRYEEHTFERIKKGLVDYGGYFYAPQVLRERGGRRLMWGWIRDGRDEEGQREAGWSGAMTLPRVVSLRGDGAPRYRAAPELRLLRGKFTHYENVSITPSSQMIPDVRGDGLEILAVLRPADAQRCGVKVRCSPDEEEATLVTYDAIEERLVLDRRKASRRAIVANDERGGPLLLGDEEPLTLHIYLDRSVIEVLGNYRTCLTGWVYPSREDSLGLRFFAEGGEAELISLDVWEMRSMWADV